jgi:murein DD-endopeptidase MepM/ murein hydrolase activator NlpD
MDCVRGRTRRGSTAAFAAALAAAALLALAGCSRSGDPAPVTYGGGTAAVPTPPVKPVQWRVQSAAPARAGLHTVERGETVYGLSRRYRVPIRSIIEANDLAPPYRLEVGQELRIPVPQRHVVRRGDTVYGISRAYGVSMSAITRVNDIDPPYTIRPGQKLLIPAERGPRTQTAAADSAGERGTRAQRSQDNRSRTGGKPATRPAPSTPSPSPASPSTPASSDGDSGAAERAQPSRRAKASDEPAPAAASAPEPEPPKATQAAAPRPKEVPSPPPRSSGRFQWPVTGKILSGFGPQDGGLHNDGINIAAPRGTPIRAAENGVVAYVGNELKGFGNLLLIKHADNWITAYAHTEEILVAHGETVSRGDIVARVGSSGNVADPQLHFEIRKRSKAKDPQRLLGRQEARRAPTGG